MKVACLLFCLLGLSLASDKVFGTRTIENTPASWKHMGAADASHPISFMVALEQHNLEELESLFWDVANPESANYRNFMSIEDITSLVAPPVKVQKKIMRWLVDNGAEQLENHGDTIYAKSTVAVASKLFNTEFSVFEHVETGKRIVRQFGEFSVPHHFAKHIHFVSGLSEFPTPRFNLKKSVSKPETLVAIAPPSIEVIYKTHNAKITGNSSAGVIEFEDQYYSPSELATFAKQFGVDIPALTANHIIGTNDGSNPQTEATLDIQYILGVAIGSKGWFWIENDNVWLYGFANHMFTTKDVPLVNSISYGWNEEQQCQDGIGGAECQTLGVDNTEYVKRVNTEFQKLGLRGITLISASGDSGANGRTDPDCSESHLNPVFPGASPYITSVGATQISSTSGKANLPNPPPGCSGQNCASAGVEECVSYDQAGFASGGGFSKIAPIPAHQRTAVANYFKSGVKLPQKSYYNPDGRGFPDVSAFGSNILIYTTGSIQSVGGTSASAPIFAGIVTYLNDYANVKTGKPLGHIAPLLYKMAEEHPAAFTDVVTGDNKCTEDGCSSSCEGFYAAKGWDPVSGLGTPVYSEMLKYIEKKL
eukprot:TRINITY_DN1328_c0_g2_i3.p1 TRINITY_DN1328_c0_g2~~TRINITY_DN1328_c0_g2_i3.p1  ORF type:complete len:593 (-),score=167.96 TRINITY_DN1328_c0_g2_i3:35-1813(-)